MLGWFLNLRWKRGPYKKTLPTLVSNNVSNYDEVGRWVLDRRGIAYLDESHAPGFYIPFVNSASGQTGGFNGPVYLSRQTMVYKSINIIDYFDGKDEPEQRLIPAEADAQKEVRDLFEYYHVNVESPVANYVYSSLLPHRKYSVPLFSKGVPWWERLFIWLFYSKFADILWSGLSLDDDSRAKSLSIVKKEFDKVAERLSDGRKYLTGSRFTAADMMLASAAAPCLMPDNYGGSIPSLDRIPASMRTEVEALRRSVAGQFVLRLYEQDRPSRATAASPAKVLADAGSTVPERVHASQTMGGS